MSKRNAPPGLIHVASGLFHSLSRVCWRGKLTAGEERTGGLHFVIVSVTRCGTVTNVARRKVFDYSEASSRVN